MTQAALVAIQNLCDKCANTIEPDGFCSWHGQLCELWLCDDCVHALRGAGTNYGPKRPVPTLNQLENSIGMLELAIRNMGMIDIMTGQDSAMSNRDVSLYLNFRESKQVYGLMVSILRGKLEAAKDVAAQGARDLLKKLDQ